MRCSYCGKKIGRKDVEYDRLENYHDWRRFFAMVQLRAFCSIEHVKLWERTSPGFVGITG